MKVRSIPRISLFLLALTLFSFAILSKEWKAESEKAKIHFTVPSRGHYGDLSGLKCIFRFDPLNPSLSYISASVDVNTLTTDRELLTRHLKTPEYFDAAHHPIIAFTSDSVTSSDTGFVAWGKLDMKTTVKPVQIPFRFISDGRTARAIGSFSILAGDFGIGKSYKGSRDKVFISIDVPFLNP